VSKIVEIISALSLHGFICIALGCDGATENRSAIKQLLEREGKTLREALPDDIRNRVMADFDNNKLPWEMKIAFPHPTMSKILIFVGANVPHGVKKLVNALEKRDLLLDVEPIKLKMLSNKSIILLI
jgi:hypothetical protein